MKFILYQTINTVNKKIYIGVHKTKNPDQFDGYIGNGVYVNKPSTYMSPNSPFQYAVKKYGTDKFIRSVLYIYDTPQEAFDKEAEIVNIDFIKNKNNYNIALGGSMPSRILSYPIYQFSPEGDLIKKWEYLEDAVDFYNYSSEAFYGAISFRERLCGFYWSRENIIDISKYSNPTPKKKVYQYDISGKCINIFNSIREAYESLGLTRTIVSEGLKYQRLINDQYYLIDTLYDQFTPKARKSLRGLPVYLYKESGEFIQKFTTVSELQKYLGVKSYNVLHRAINTQNGKYKTYQIFLEYKGELTEASEKYSNLPKKVDVFLKDSTFIKTCDSVQKAAKEFGAKLSSINRVLRGLAVSTNGYIFKFHDTD